MNYKDYLNNNSENAAMPNFNINIFKLGQEYKIHNSMWNGKSKEMILIKKTPEVLGFAVFENNTCEDVLFLDASTIKDNNIVIEEV